MNNQEHKIIKTFYHWLKDEYRLVEDSEVNEYLEEHRITDKEIKRIIFQLLDEHNIQWLTR